MSDEPRDEIDVEPAPRVDRKGFRLEYVEQARKLAQLGATDAEIADFFEVARYTITRWKTRHKAFAEALKVGKDVADDRVEASLYHRAVGYTYEAVKIFNHRGEIIRAEYTEHVAPDVTAQIFWLKNRRKDEWRDKQTHEHTGKDGAAIEHKATVEAVMELLPKVRDEC